MSELDIAKSRFETFLQTQPLVKQQILTSEPTTRSNVGTITTTEEKVSVKINWWDMVTGAFNLANPLNMNLAKMIWGTREEKANIAGSAIGADVKTEIIQTDTSKLTGETTTKVIDTTFLDFQDKLNQQIDTLKKESEANKQFWETATIGTTDIETPNLFGDWSQYVKWAVIGGGILIGLYLIGKIFSGGKK